MATIRFGRLIRSRAGYVVRLNRHLLPVVIESVRYELLSSGWVPFFFAAVVVVVVVVLVAVVE